MGNPPATRVRRSPMRPFRLPAGLHLAVLLASALIAAAGHAASLQISPIRIDLPSVPGAGALQLRNQGDVPIHAQVRVFRWTQSGRDDVLEPTDTVVASPPIIRIAPGDQQLVRVVHPQAAAAAAGETTYRLLIDELPQGDNGPASGVRVQLRYSVPVFVGTPDAGVVPPLRFALLKDGGEWRLVARNDGNRHAQISDVTLIGRGGTKYAVTAGLLGYALAKSGRQWSLPPERGMAPSAGWRLEATVNGTRVSAPLDVASAGNAVGTDAR